MALSADDEKFLDDFEACTLAPAGWGQRELMRMAWLRLANEPFEDALELIRAGLRNYAAEHKSVIYHDTATTAFVHLIHLRRQQAPDVSTWEEFIKRNPDLMDPSKPILEAFYTPELLNAPLSRAKFVGPNRRPFRA